MTDRWPIPESAYTDDLTADKVSTDPLPPLRDVEWPSDQMLEAAWGIIANAGGGDWTLQTPAWRLAAVRWREAYHRSIHDTGDQQRFPSGHTRPPLGKVIGQIFGALATLAIFVWALGIIAVLAWISIQWLLGVGQ